MMEICVDSIESARNAIDGGADRLEVCSALSEGGLTPTPGLIKSIHQLTAIRASIYAMIRIRSGNFVYTRDEMDGMLHDLEILKNHGVDGFVFGALKPDGSIDIDFCHEIVASARPKFVTFHRAFDEAINPTISLETIIDLGFERILTSGQCDRAIDGLDLIRKLVQNAKSRIVIMPGSGINAENIKAIKCKTGAEEFHASAKEKVQMPSGGTKVKFGANDHPGGHYVMVTSEEMVKEMVEIVKNMKL